MSAPRNADAILKLYLVERLRNVGSVKGSNTIELIAAFGLSNIVGKEQFDRVFQQLIKSKAVFRKENDTSYWLRW